MPPTRHDEVARLRGKEPVVHSDSDRVMLRTRDVAQFLHVHLNTVRRWSKKGILKSYRVSSRGDRRFKREDIDAFLKGG